PGAMTAVQRLGNMIAPLGMRLLAGARYSDMPPFKAMKREALDPVLPSDTGYGFTVELLLRAHARGLRVREVVVRCRRRRPGRSKVSGSPAAALRAALKILATIGRHAFTIRLERRAA